MGNKMRSVSFGLLGRSNGTSKTQITRKIEEIWNQFNSNLPLTKEESTLFKSRIDVEVMPYRQKVNWVDISNSVLKAALEKQIASNPLA